MFKLYRICVVVLSHLQSSNKTNLNTYLCCRFALPMFLFADYLEAAFWPKPKHHWVCILHFHLFQGKVGVFQLIVIYVLHDCLSSGLLVRVPCVSLFNAFLCRLIKSELELFPRDQEFQVAMNVVLNFQVLMPPQLLL